MIKILIKLAIFGIIITILTVFSNWINNLIIWEYLTQFFVFLRQIIRPMDWLWDFETSWTILGVALSIAIAYLPIKAALIVKNNI